MSASSKKKFRKELNAADMTEKQQMEQKEAAKLHRMTAGFLTILALIIVIAGVTLAVKGYTVSGIRERSSVALTVGDYKVNTAELSYFYNDVINQYYSDMSEIYGDKTILSIKMSSGLDLTAPLDSQKISDDSEDTWADYFLDSAINKAHLTYALYQDALAHDFKLSSEEDDLIQLQMSYLPLLAQSRGFRNENSFLKAIYGNGANKSGYLEFLKISSIANSYANQHYADLKYSDEELRKAESGKEAEYNSYSFTTAYINSSVFLPEGTKDDNGNVTYTDAEKEAALEKAEAAAKNLAEHAASSEELEKAVAAMDINKETKNVVSNHFKDQSYRGLNSSYSKWLSDSNRKPGDITYVPNEFESKDKDGKTVTETLGYYVVVFESQNNNNFALANVRHILTKFKGGTADENGSVTYSDEEKAAAKAAADELLKTWKSGEATAESFAALATEKTEDDGSKQNGGLYENVLPKQMAESFDNWCFEEGRKAGDTGIVETVYGCHVMYYVGDSEMLYRDYLISNDLKEADTVKWQDSLVEANALVEKDTSLINTGVAVLR